MAEFGSDRLVSDDDRVLHHFGENLDLTVRSDVDFFGLYAARRAVFLYSSGALRVSSE